MTDRAELRALTAMRGIAAWWVVLYHVRGALGWLPQTALDFLGKGYLAVDFFFLLSGFVIWLTYAQRIREGGFAAIPGFLRRRIARIWPLHLLMLGGAIALALLLAATGRGDGGEFPPAELPAHILLVQDWGFARALAWNDPAWSISAELGAYLIFPLLALAIDWRRMPSWAVLAALAALLMLLHAIMAANDMARLGQDIERFGLIRCLIEFAGGTAIGALWLRWRDRPRLPALAAAAIAPIFLAAFVAGVLPETLAVPAGFAAALLALALTSGRPGNPLETRALHWLGEISYATYLGHFLLWFAFKLAFVRDLHAVPPALVLAYLAAVLASSALLHHTVERPAQRWLNGTRPDGRRRYSAAA